MKKILVSACLVGDKVTYDKRSHYHPLIKELLKYYELVPFCPEVEGGLKIPRKKSERRRNEVKNEVGLDVTKQFNLGAEKALNICQYLNIKMAILKEDSPSCGVHKIYNGLFQGRKIPGQGWTTELLTKHGIKIISENEIEDLLKIKKAEEDRKNKKEKSGK
ncbi:MAG: DUF523 domain-containing protein [Bacilli bacterium]|nr:DUF523 domain-containing protein [Bacilli bacterium]